MLEPEAVPRAAPSSVSVDAAAKPASEGEPKAPAAATPAPSLADQLLGLLGALGTPAATTAAPPPATATKTADAAAPGPPVTPPAVRGPAVPTLALAQPGTALATSVATAAPASSVAHAMQGAAIATEFMLDRGAGNAPAPAGADPAALAMRDAAPLAGPAPLPAAVDRLPAVPQPALLQPANPNAGYGDDLGSSVVWMAEHRVGHASMQVSPDHLGPIEVRLQIDGARVHAEFFSAQPDVRHALEASLPRLRDMLGQQGLQLGQADVGQRQRNDTPRTPTGDRGQSDCFPDESRPLPAVLRRARGLVDEYA
jgi:flagellar hook-length control protein FliK